MLQNLSLLTQFGLSVASPLVLCLVGAAFAANRFGLGTWIYVPALVFGLGGSACAFLEFLKLIQRRSQKSGTDKKDAPGASKRGE